MIINEMAEKQRELNRLVEQSFANGLLKQIYSDTILESLLPDRPPPSWRERMVNRTKMKLWRLKKAWKVLIGDDYE